MKQGFLDIGPQAAQKIYPQRKENKQVSLNLAPAPYLESFQGAV